MWTLCVAPPRHPPVAAQYKPLRLPLLLRAGPHPTPPGPTDPTGPTRPLWTPHSDRHTHTQERGSHKASISGVSGSVAVGAPLGRPGPSGAVRGPSGGHPGAVRGPSGGHPGAVRGPLHVYTSEEERRDLRRRRASSESPTGPRLGVLALWLMARYVADMAACGGRRNTRG